MELSGPAATRGPRPVRVLPVVLVDQIAAGEVVERPSSVVKELVENSVDADAGRIRVEVRGGGTELIAVSDDGWGMTEADARLALERHATSKIESPADLTRIGTFGFRGEALPAVASVSRMRVRTRARGVEEAVEIRLDAGRVVECRVGPGAEGTRVEVAELFINVPARRKFLKSPTTEWGHVADWLARAALALPRVHFDVRRDDRPAVVWPAVDDPLERVAAVLSEREAEALVSLAAERGGVRVHGFVSRPDRHRPTAAGLYAFVNGRPVRDRLLRHALLDAYRDVLPRGRFPTAVLFVEVSCEGVDVNVHPAKWEVRFSDPTAVHRLVADSVREAMGARRWLAPAAEALPGRPAARRFEATRIAEPLATDWVFARSESPGASGLATTLGPGEGRPGPTSALAGPGPGEEAPLKFSDLQLLGQALATYVVLEAPDGLLLVDQHAAHERVLYERLRTGWKAGGVARQPLLLVETLELPPASAATLTAVTTALERLGFEVEPFGETAVAVRAVPALLAGRDPAGLVRALADQLDPASREGLSGADAPAVEAADRLFASLACHSARRKGERLSPAEQRTLLEALDALPWAPTCPHGRPIAFRLGLAEIERRFARR